MVHFQSIQYLDFGPVRKIEGGPKSKFEVRISNTINHVINYTQIVIRVDQNQNGEHMRHVTKSEPDQKVDPRVDYSKKILVTFLHF